MSLDLRTMTSLRDGIALRYELADGALRPIVFVHGWCCDRGYFAPQLEDFASRGHAVVAVDLRGHGDSDKPERDYSMAALADDVAWLARELGLERPVVVGHSMGGVVAYDLGVRHPDLAAGIVMIDAAVARPAASRAAMPAFLETLRGPDYRDALAAYVERALFLPTDDAERRTWILARMQETPRHVLIAAFEGMHEFDPGAPGSLRAPSLFIAAGTPPLSELPRLSRLVPGLLVGRTVGSGHFCQLEVPDQVNAMIARFLALLEPPA